VEVDEQVGVVGESINRWREIRYPIHFLTRRRHGWFVDVVLVLDLDLEWR
jgi:hypothetical protein